MGIFKRMKDIASADMHNRLDKIEDPIRMMKQYLSELEKEIQKGKNSLSQQLFVVKKYEALIVETNETIEKRASQAELAISQNEEDMAKMFLEEKINQENKLALYQTQLDTVKKQTEVLIEQLERLQEKYQELTNRKLTLISRAAAAQASYQFDQSIIPLNPENALKGFSRAEDKILEMEANASASHYFIKSSSVDNSKKLPHLVDAQVEAELAKLKEGIAKQV
ncbi:PspA/IM30 family protein [Niallia oryzisoli]|uniref:PspA/IM30 family protein n=1 Tax=Niallia oryzisoli TaxID=1737571 RepID=A0ABZ2C6C6_9BACI